MGKITTQQGRQSVTNIHYQSVFRTSKIAQVVAHSEEEILGIIVEHTKVTSNPWAVNVTLNGVSLLFKIDMGADMR